MVVYASSQDFVETALGLDTDSLFVERPAGGAIEILAGGFEGADGVRRGDSGDELLTPLPCPENIASFLKNTGVMQCSATGCDV
jgi:hypothetical protein